MKQNHKYTIIYNFIITTTIQFVAFYLLEKVITDSLISGIMGFLVTGAILLSGGAIYYMMIKNKIFRNEE